MVVSQDAMTMTTDLHTVEEESLAATANLYDHGTALDTAIEIEIEDTAAGVGTTIRAAESDTTRTMGMMILANEGISP